MLDIPITPGEWVVEPGTFTVSAPDPTRQHAMRIPIALLPSCIRYRAANAKAIAAVPTMLKALQQIERLANEASCAPEDAPRIRAAMAEIAHRALCKATESQRELQEVAA